LSLRWWLHPAQKGLCCVRGLRVVFVVSFFSREFNTKRTKTSSGATPPHPRNTFRHPDTKKPNQAPCFCWWLMCQRDQSPRQFYLNGSNLRNPYTLVSNFFSFAATPPFRAVPAASICQYGQTVFPQSYILLPPIDIGLFHPEHLLNPPAHEGVPAVTITFILVSQHIYMRNPCS